MDKRIGKKILACVLSLFILGGTLYVADSVLKETSEHGVKQSLALYHQPKESIDVLVLGSSHVHYGVNTAKLWEDHGIAAYDYSSAEQSLWVSYHYLIEACKTQKPSVVVLDFFSPAAFDDTHKYKYTYLSDTLYGFKFSINKLQMMHACFDGDLSLWNQYFPGFIGYHDMYVDAELEDLYKLFADYEDFKGFTPYFKMDSVPMYLPNTEDIMAPSDKSIEYLDKIVEYTRKNDIKLYITIVPYCLNEGQVEGVVQHEDQRYNWLEQYVNKLKDGGDEHVYFDYTFKHIESFDLRFGEGTDMYDNSHLNYYGSCKFTDYLGKDLLERYGRELIPDHRGDPNYLSWDRNVQIIRQDVADHGFEWR